MMTAHRDNKLRTLPGTVCVVMSALFVGSGSATATIVVDGNVGGLAEGYTEGYDVSFDIENGPTGVSGGKLFLMETSASLTVGFIAPLTVNDNTYGNNRASDWGAKKHFLVGKGGESLAGSDKWEIKIDNFGSTGKKLELKLDYIEEDQGDFDAQIEKFKLGHDNIESAITFHTSLDYNYHVLGLTDFFSSDEDNPVESPGPRPAPSEPDGPVVYSFDSPAENWIPEIMYEFELQKSAFDGSGFSLTSSSFRQQLFMESVFHMSPNKLGGNKVWVSENNVIPEPCSLVVWFLIGMSFAGGGWWRRSRVAA